MFRRCLSVPGLSTTLVGVRNVAEARENVATFEWELKEAQIKELDEAIEKYLDFDGAANIR